MRQGRGQWQQPAGGSIVQGKVLRAPVSVGLPLLQPQGSIRAPLGPQASHLPPCSFSAPPSSTYHLEMGFQPLGAALSSSQELGLPPMEARHCVRRASFQWVEGRGSLHTGTFPIKNSSRLRVTSVFPWPHRSRAGLEPGTACMGCMEAPARPCAPAEKLPMPWANSH